MLQLQIDAHQLDQLAFELQATDDQVRKALNSAVRKMNTTIRRAAMRKMSGSTGLPQKRFARRIRSFRISRGAGGWKVFIGLDSINLLELGAKETDAGVRARGREIKGAFIATGRAGAATVFKRTSAARLPIQQQRHDIAPIGDDILDNAERIFNARFMKLFQAELKWRTQTLK